MSHDMIGITFPVIDVSSVEALILGISTVTIFTIPLLVNAYKTAHDAIAQLREVRPQVRDNTKRINEHARALDGGLDARISDKVQELVRAHRTGAGDDATTGQVPPVGEVGGTSSDSG